MSLFKRTQDAAKLYSAVPGAERPDDELPPPEAQAAMLTEREDAQRIGLEEIREAATILQKYKTGKAHLEQRIVEDEKWWELRHWEVIKSPVKQDSHGWGADKFQTPKPTSAWLFNAIANKHADAMDNYPEALVLPREKSDEVSAKTLSSVLPVVLENSGFRETYSNGWWEKLKHGTAAYGVFWNAGKENGLGDIDVREIDLLKIFWEPGVTDVQKSRNLFILDLADTDLLEEQYPQFKGRMGSGTVDIRQYMYSEEVDTTGKSVVVDWYYKRKAPDGRNLLHYVKFVGDCLLYASENDPAYRDRGFYDHGRYPVEFDSLFPEKGTPVGFGYVAICKDPQVYIDALFGNILESSMMATKKRFFVSTSTNVNPEQFADWNQRIVPVEGELSESRIQEIRVDPISPIYTNILQMKIEEMKDTASNRDVNSGGTGSGVTAASAIAALQEAGNKVSRDMISSSYSVHGRICALCIELMRQFYDEARSFRITGRSDTPGEFQFVSVSNAELKDRLAGAASDGSALYRRPIFDLKVIAQKRNPFSRMEQNERAKELYALGFFNPERAQEALYALEMMDFEGIDKIKEQVRAGRTAYNELMAARQQVKELVALIGQITGQKMPTVPASAPAEGGTGTEVSGADVDAGQGRSFSDRVLEAHTPMTPLGQRLAKDSAPSVEG